MARRFHPGKSNVFLAIACLFCFSTAQASLAVADVATKAAHKEGDADANTHDLVQGAHVEGHIAFLKAELGITPAQETLWAPVATAMRQDVSNLQEEETRIERKPPVQNSIEYLQNRVLFANLRAQGEARFLAAFSPLYAALSPQQQQAADAILMPGMMDRE